MSDLPTSPNLIKQTSDRSEIPFVSRFAESLNSLVPSSVSVVLAVSGGADSVALLHAWARSRVTHADRIIVATFDHQLRDDSAADAQFVVEVAAQLGLEFEVGTPKSPLSSREGRSLDGAARDARYAFLSEVARRNNAAFVATAHTANDQVETVLHRIMRGTGLQGLAGISPRRRLAEEIDLIRPMLSMNRAEVEAFLSSIGQEYRNDPTNGDSRFTRNRIRHQLLPTLRADFNPAVDLALRRLADLARSVSEEETRVIQELTAKVVRERTNEAVYFDRAELRLLGEYRVMSIIRSVIEQQGWPMRRIGMMHLTRIARLCHLERSTRITLPHEMVAFVSKRQGVVGINRPASQTEG